jgi:chitinase
MSPGEIPVSLLTHLNVAFGYVNSAFQVTNMDGVSPDIYKSVGDVKSRNPSIKLIIALGGWSFSDPGEWQSVFPTLVSSEANRATFIQNLLGFLSEYGYDGVDFDWEYPGADDRGGSSEDGVNYTSLLKELRAAIDASGKDYTVTFTAPTSYWYLQHFDLANMVQYADWVNLMAYDLHGVWDSDDPIGNQVLAHTNLTEIDLALDLFWRVGVDPADIVLGLGFYGRSFQLTDPSCWKPGCEFSGPGAAGSCTATAGILSYREINQILTSTGATAYLDTEAAVRYLVYGNNSWISFDDATTFKAKIDYANSMGLGGLMVWAVDLDDNNLDALNAISSADEIGAVDNPFTLVDLKYLSPTEDLPANGTTPSYGLVNFGSLADSGSMNPSQTAFGFLLIAGDSYAVTQLRKRDGLPDPFVFLDCPPDVTSQPKDNVQTARVTCMTDDLEGCFRVMERGVEGTIVEMPDNVSH